MPSLPALPASFKDNVKFDASSPASISLKEMVPLRLSLSRAASTPIASSVSTTYAVISASVNSGASLVLINSKT